MGAVKAAQRSPRRSSCNYGRTYAYRAESALDPELRVAPRVHCTFIVAHIFIYYMYTARGRARARGCVPLCQRAVPEALAGNVYRAVPY